MTKLDNFYDWDAILDGLTKYLRIRATPIGMKLFETVEEMEAVEKIRRPKGIFTADQIWYETPEDARNHQAAMTVMPAGQFRAMAVSPLASKRLNPPDICLIYATPAQMILFINGLQWAGYKKLDFSVVGESSCADSWGRALSKGEPSLSLPCFAERRYGGVQEDELLMAIPPAYLPKVIDGLAALAKNGLRYPIPPYGVQNDARAGLAVSYSK